ncbi:MAG: PilZ domain-containing protein [Phycisphaerae bacterium]
MGGENERRRHRRLLVRTGILCRKIGSMHDHAFVGDSINISPDGLLVESSQTSVTDTGDLFDIELDIPVADRADQIGGKVSAYAKVVRIMESDQKAGKKQIAFQFCTRPQFNL